MHSPDALVVGSSIHPCQGQCVKFRRLASVLSGLIETHFVSDNIRLSLACNCRRADYSNAASPGQDVRNERDSLLATLVHDLPAALFDWRQTMLRISPLAGDRIAHSAAEPEQCPSRDIPADPARRTSTSQLLVSVAPLSRQRDFIVPSIFRYRPCRSRCRWGISEWYACGRGQAGRC